MWHAARFGDCDVHSSRRETSPRVCRGDERAPSRKLGRPLSLTSTTWQAVPSAIVSTELIEYVVTARTLCATTQFDLGPRVVERREQLLDLVCPGDNVSSGLYLAIAVGVTTSSLVAGCFSHGVGIKSGLMTAELAEHDLLHLSVRRRFAEVRR